MLDVGIQVDGFESDSLAGARSAQQGCVKDHIVLAARISHVLRRVGRLLNEPAALADRGRPLPVANSMNKFQFFMFSS